jgi:hypothetical protein
MATADLYLVTKTLQRLLEFNVQLLLARAGPPVPSVSVTTKPPAKVVGEPRTLNLHLYHALEDAHYKNLPPTGPGRPPVARQPLALLLYYILTAHHQADDDHDAETQQRYLGLAMKTLHDHPVVDDSLALPPKPGDPAELVMAPGLEGAGNRLEIALRPLTPEEALTFWSADQTTPRLSAYYEVRSVFLEPEQPDRVIGLAYDLGLFVAAGRAPRIDKVAGIVAFTPPAESGMGPQALKTAPARATLAPGLDPPVNRIELSGTALAGDGSPGGAGLVLRSEAWRQREPPVRAVRVDPARNPDWAVTLDERSGRFDLQGGVKHVVNGVEEVLAVTPGIYTVSVEAVRRRQTRAGLSRAVTSESNQIAFSVGARIDRVDPPNAAGRLVLKLLGGAVDLTADDPDIQLAVDGMLYVETDAFDDDPDEDAGCFRRDPDGVEFHPLFDPAQPGAHPLRLVVNGAESQPFWVVAP